MPAVGSTATGDAEPAADADERSSPRSLEAGTGRSPRLPGQRTTPPPIRPARPGSPALRRRFHDLGAVNPFAADEYAEVRTRLDGLETPADGPPGGDRAHARADRRAGPPGRASSSGGRSTALERAFDDRFQQLFGGGYARLSLTDPQDLASTGIEITARPPGKKAQALAMLSGGERALTAVALLFAMLEVRPVPFCVLDEVDAALDEANIGRFTDALKDLARDHPVHRHHPQPGHDRGRRRAVRRHRR